MSVLNHTYATLNDWIAREAVPISLGSPDGFNADVDRMMASLGESVRVLGLGEPLHGGEDFLVLRNRLFQRLVEAHGFTAIAVESSFPRGHAIDRYVTGGGTESFDAVCDSGFSHGFGRLETSRELIQWMRQYNAGLTAEPRASSSNSVPLRFYGFDSPTEMSFTDSPRQLLQFVLDDLASIDAEAAESHRQRIEPLLGQDADWENPAANFDPAKSIGLSPAATSLRLETEELLTTLSIRRPELTARGGADRYLEALHHVGVARQLLTYHAAVARSSDDRLVRLLGIRDAMMADNLAYAANRERRRALQQNPGGNGGRVLAFAHNSHLKRGQAQWQLGPSLLAWWPAGAQITEVLGPGYAVIGTGVGMSDANGIGPPESGTIEALLTATDGPARFIPTFHGQRLPTAVISAISTRSGSTRNPTYFPLNSGSFSDYDALLVLDSTTYSRGGPALPHGPDSTGG